jgi:hypothetical protein
MREKDTSILVNDKNVSISACFNSTIHQSSTSLTNLGDYTYITFISGILLISPYKLPIIEGNPRTKQNGGLKKMKIAQATGYASVHGQISRHKSLVRQRLSDLEKNPKKKRKPGKRNPIPMA